MIQILTYGQALAVATAMSGVAAEGGVATRFSFPTEAGSIRVRWRKSGAIVVMRIDDGGQVLAQRSYGNLAYFVAQHRRGEST